MKNHNPQKSPVPKAIGDHVMVSRPKRGTHSKGGIYMPENQDKMDPLSYGRVVSMGAKAIEELKDEVSIGDVVAFDDCEGRAQALETDSGVIEMTMLAAMSVQFVISRPLMKHWGLEAPESIEEGAVTV